MRALVTGATGYIGGRVTARLQAEGWKTGAVVRASSVQDDLPADTFPVRDPGSAAELARAVGEFDPDVLLHLAASQSLDEKPSDSDELVEANISFGARCLSAAHAAGVRGVVLAGTFSTHSDGTDEYRPATLYAATKQAQTDLAKFYRERTSMQCVTLELSDTYGPDDPRRKFLELLANAARTGQTLDATAGEQSVRPLHVDDVACAFVVVADALMSGKRLEPVYSVAGEEEVTVQELARAFEEATGLQPQVNWGARSYRQGEIMKPYCGEAPPGWAPAMSLRDGLAAVYGTAVKD